MVQGWIARPPTKRDELAGEAMARLRREGVDRPVLSVGMGTSAEAVGARELFDAFRERLRGEDVELLELGSLGICGADPVVGLQLPGRPRVDFGPVGLDEVDSFAGALLRAKLPKGTMLGQHGAVGCRGEVPWKGVPSLEAHPFFRGQTRRVLARCGLVAPRSIDEALARGSWRSYAAIVSTRTREELCDFVEASGLRGRGGGGYPAGRKWQAALEAEGDQKYLLCNGDESDPGAFMDRALVEGDPHRVLEGLAIAAYAIGATRALVALRDEYEIAVSVMEHAVAEARRLGLLGENVLESGVSLEVEVLRGAGAFVCGEETALIRSLEGRRGMPRPRPPWPSSHGYDGRPTVVHNVETLANLPVLFELGIEAYKAVGTSASPGTKVFCLTGPVRRPGLVEVAMGTTLRSILEGPGGGMMEGRSCKAMQLGGPSGLCLPEGELDLALCWEAVDRQGAMIGSGGLVALSEEACMVDMARYFMAFLQQQSCGKCIPCREGTRRMLEILEAVVESGGAVSPGTALERFRGVLVLEGLGEVMADTSLCGLGRTAPNPVLSLLRWFREELEAHVFERRCPAGVCPGLRHGAREVEA